MRILTTLLLGAAVWLAGLLPLTAQTSSSITGSGHDLSVTGPGPVTSASNDLCVFCHIPHGGRPAVPLWNHQLSSLDYSLYTSSTYSQVNPGGVSQRSKLCLSCHDGTVAVGQTAGGGYIATSGAMRSVDIIGAGGLQADHPLGFNMPAVDDGEIKLSLTTMPPTTSDRSVKLYHNVIECVTCHSPHVPNNDTATQFMVRSNTNSAMCIACHDPTRGVLNGWTASAHALATNAVSLTTSLPYPTPGTVGVNGCESCHVQHNSAGGGARLLRGVDPNECVDCHGNSGTLSPALPNLIPELTKAYSHPVLSSPSPGHDPAEAIPVVSSRHSACSDCHNSHVSQAVTGTPTPPALEASLAGTSGLSATDGLTVLKPAANQFEICFKCHANSTDKPQNVNYVNYGRTPYRNSYVALGDPYNVRLALRSVVARHNVAQPSRGNVSPSLRTNMLDLNGNPTGRLLQGAGLYLYCTDCHNNDQARISGGTGPNGPHGSANYHLLERPYQYEVLPLSPGALTVGPSYSPGLMGPYAICDKCHDLQNQLLTSSSSADTVFKHHYEHVVQDASACSTCHASHGVQGGSSTSNAHLVDFDTKIVGPDNLGRLFIDTTARACYLTCHGVVHNPANY